MSDLSLSVAHRRSAFAVVDPVYAVETCQPPLRADELAWLYPRAEYECFLLQRMRHQVAEAKLKVGYPGCFHQPVDTVWFRRSVAAGRLCFNASGTVAAVLNGRPLPVASEGGNGRRQLEIPEDGQLILRISVADPELVAPGLAVTPDDWEASIDGELFEAAVRGGAPAGEELPTVELRPRPIGAGCWDAGCELLATVEIRCAARPRFGAGESLAEAVNTDPAWFEQNLELQQTAAGLWRSVVPLAFRYLWIEAAGAVDVVCRAIFTPERYRGAFAADPELTRIWQHAAYTLRLCIHHFQIDGIKRDRLPWVGDLALSLLANAYCFGDPEPVRRTLTVLGRAGIRRGHLNGIIDYSLWFVICHDLFQLYFGDRAFLRRQYRELRELMECLLEQAGEDGFLPAGEHWLFIDWVDGRKETALQMLFCWALEAFRRLALRVADAPLAERCRSRAERLKKALYATAYDRERGLFFSAPDEPEAGFTRHANFLAILAGVAGEAETGTMIRTLCEEKLPPVGTPYMAALELLAYARGGAADAAVERIRRLWGGMLQDGATTFYEACATDDRSPEKYEFYGRRYGLSLCHAWSAGPAALLPLIFFGCEPLEDGWRSFRLAPRCYDPEQAVTIPTPAGEISVEFRRGSWKLDCPDALHCRSGQVDVTR